MRTPTVSFVVPCYRLAHLLGDCVRSILSQTYGDLEVLIMDDASPDDTPEVARSFGDERVRHVRNDPNLGHLRNYNKGIQLAQGRYVWLISADDYLRRPYVLQRYVDLLERRPSVGFTFCSGVGVREGAETGVVEWARWEGRDRIIPGQTLVRALLRRNRILAPSGLVRRACYEQHGAFPLDMPWAGDWYLWCLFSLYSDAACFPEPMVCYRQHALTMTSHLTAEKATACRDEEIRLRWTIQRRAREAGLARVARAALEAIADGYALSMVDAGFPGTGALLTPGDLEASLQAYAANAAERDWVRARVHAALGSLHQARGNYAQAARSYGAALGQDPWMPAVAVKRALLGLGPPGHAVHRALRSMLGRLNGTDGR